MVPLGLLLLSLKVIFLVVAVDGKNVSVFVVVVTDNIDIYVFFAIVTVDLIAVVVVEDSLSCGSVRISDN